MKEGNKKTSLILRPVEKTDAQAITDIYNHYVTETTVSFETEPLTLEHMTQRMCYIASEYPYFVCIDTEANNRVVGYCCVHQWKERHAYCNTLEVTIYLDPKHKGRGAGTMMMNRLLQACREMKSVRNLIACITEENRASIAFHSKMGFEEVSHFKKVGYKFGKWLDVVDMEYEIF